jgi:hypothetical protein
MLNVLMSHRVQRVFILKIQAGSVMLFRGKIKFRIDQATKLLAMKSLYNIYNVHGVLSILNNCVLNIK